MNIVVRVVRNSPTSADPANDTAINPASAVRLADSALPVMSSSCHTAALIA